MKLTHKLLDWQRQAIVDAYLAGEKVEAIGEEFGVAYRYPSILARRKGHGIRRIGRPRKTEQRQTLVLVS